MGITVPTGRCWESGFAWWRCRNGCEAALTPDEGVRVGGVDHISGGVAFLRRCTGSCSAAGRAPVGCCRFGILGGPSILIPRVGWCWLGLWGSLCGFRFFFCWCWSWSGFSLWCRRGCDSSSAASTSGPAASTTGLPGPSRPSTSTRPGYTSSRASSRASSITSTRRRTRKGKKTPRIPPRWRTLPLFQPPRRNGCQMHPQFLSKNPPQAAARCSHHHAYRVSYGPVESGDRGRAVRVQVPHPPMFQSSQSN